MIEVKIPSPGESISEVEIASWLVGNGDYVEKDQEIAEIESDKATLPLVAEANGTIEILAQEGDTIAVGEVACKIDDSAQAPEKTEQEETGVTKEAQQEEPKTEQPKEKAKPEETEAAGRQEKTKEKEQESSEKTTQETQPRKTTGYEKVKTTPVANKMMQEYDLSVEDIIKGLRRITRQDVNQAVEGLKKPQAREEQPQTRPQGSREANRQKMSRLRRKLSERLVSVKNETAMLTTFNEVDMTEVIRLRKQYQKAFQEKHGVKLGFMSFFIKASAKALQDFPNVNSMIDGEEIVYPQYADIAIAVQTPKGLMVPVIRNAESLSLAQLEQKVKEFGEKGQNNRISIDEMEGGTFSITNGGVFGSMLSTPIINPPQSAILGMHNIQERPVAVDGNVVIRPMMYIALSYDHRTIDGKDSVSFLVRIKELLEKPQNLLLEAGSADKQLLGL
jgi:2-oxoglutarate dehydrogenase E2 component (dihydrolipoamide succinyltransferase)